MKHSIITLVILFSFYKIPTSLAQDKRVTFSSDSSNNFFYHNQDYGSESQFGHLNVITNIGFSVVGPQFWGYRLGDIPFNEGVRELGESFAHPSLIKDYYGSYGTFFYQEFVPIVGFASYPNYIFHFAGEGMLTRKLYEYNLSKGYSKFKSRLFSISTMVTAQVINEIIEAPITWRGDAVSDIVFFNTAGIIAFSYDRFAHIFSNKNVKLFYWPGQPLIDLRDGVMYNNTETYMLRTTMGNWTKVKLGFMLGLPSSFGIGLTYPVDEQDNISAFAILGQSPIVPKFPYVKPYVERSLPVSQRPAKTVNDSIQYDFQSAFRFTWDRKGSLMTSLEIGYPKMNYTLNIYPGVMKIAGFNFGTFVFAGKNYPTTIGVTLKWLPIMPGFRFN